MAESKSSQVLEYVKIGIIVYLAYLFITSINSILTGIGLKDDPEVEKNVGEFSANSKKPSRFLFDPNAISTLKSEGKVTDGDIQQMSDNWAFYQQLVVLLFDSWRVIDDDEEQLYSVFRSLKNQKELAFLCSYWNLYRGDAMNAIEQWFSEDYDTIGLYLQQFLSDKEISNVVEIVNKLK